MTPIAPQDVVRSYAELLDALPIVAYMARPDGAIVYVSRGWTDLIGSRPEEVLGRGYVSVLEPADRERIIAVWDAARAAETTYQDEYRLRFADGAYRWILSQASPVRDPESGTIAGWFGTITDIDERKRTETALQTSEATHRAFAGAIPGVTWAASPDGELTFVGDQWIELHGRPRDAALGNRWIENVHEDDRARVRATWEHALATGETYDTEFRVRVADDTYRWFLVRALPVRGADGEIERWVGVNIDIEDRRRADEAREMYVALVENSEDFIGIGDAQGNAIYVNEAGRNLLNIGSLADVQGTHLLEYFRAEDRPFVESTILPAVERDGRWVGDVAFRDFRTGAPVPVEHNLFVLRAKDGAPLGIATVSRDRRERMRLDMGLRLLARTGAAALDSLDYGDTLRNIARAFVDDFASYCLIDVVGTAGWERTAVHRDRAFEELFATLPEPSAGHPIMRALATGESSVVTIDGAWPERVQSPERADAVRKLGVRSFITVPVVTPGGEVAGALTCAIDDVHPRENYADADLPFVEEVGRRAGGAIANARLYERQRRIAVELQAASLPAVLPKTAGLVLDTEYRPGSDEATIGGDWYDAFELADGRVAISVGDVLGHGLHAAVTMTKLRQAMQAAAMVAGDPDVMLDVADKTLRLVDADAYATALAAIYDRARGKVSYAVAGHPGPLVRYADGRIEECLNHGTMLGLRSASASGTLVVAAPRGALFVFFTDGLTEATRDVDEGYRRLRDALGSSAVARATHPARTIVDTVLRGNVATDDVAVLTAFVEN